MKIGGITLSSPTVLAPLAGITNLPFRLIAKENGCGLVCSEMISSNGLVYHSGKTHTMLESVAKQSLIFTKFSCFLEQDFRISTNGRSARRRFFARF